MAELGLSEYEQLRQKNIQRNRDVMKALGLDDNDFALHRAHKEAETVGATKKKPTNKGKRKREIKADPEGVRRSTRLQGSKPDNAGLAYDEDEPGQHRPVHVKEEAPLRGSESSHALAEAEHLRWAGKQEKATVVGTASYKHTLHRVRTMNEPALYRRIKAIERACGQHAVVKMRLFARVLCLEGYDDIAEEAAEALHRLIKKLGDPEKKNEGSKVKAAEE